MVWELNVRCGSRAFAGLGAETRPSEREKRVYCFGTRIRSSGRPRRGTSSLQDQSPELEVDALARVASLRAPVTLTWQGLKRNEPAVECARKNVVDSVMPATWKASKPLAACVKVLVLQSKTRLEHGSGRAGRHARHATVLTELGTEYGLHYLRTAEYALHPCQDV